MFRDWEWSDTWITALLIAVIGMVSLAVFAMCQDHHARFYYMSDNGIKNYCINGYREWESDESGVFCSDDIEKSITVLKQLNDALARGGK